jgi:hypothetical protein
MGRRPFAPFTESNFSDDATVTSDKIGDQNVWVVTTSEVQYSFDTETGLLLRRVVSTAAQWAESPSKTEFDHYRSVGGAKVRFTTLGGSRQATTIAIGTPIPHAEFEKPSSTPVPKLH